MCELLAASFPEARPFEVLAAAVGRLEEYGLGSFGWGVAWLDGRGSVHGVKSAGRYRDEGPVSRDLLRQSSRRFLVHLRRPTKLSTIDMADTQPFFDDGRSAWCHNGLLERAGDLRHRYEGRLEGRADSEVGWAFFLDCLAEGLDAASALRHVDDTFGGRVNLGYLGMGGELAVYTRSSMNRMWRFTLDGGDIASTGLHSDDGSLFDLVYPTATDQQLLEPGTALALAPAESAVAREGVTDDATIKEAHDSPTRRGEGWVRAGARPVRRLAAGGG